MSELRTIKIERSFAEPLGIKAHVIGDFAYHRMVLDADFIPDDWDITHIPTGLSLGIAADSSIIADAIVRDIVATLDGRSLAETGNGKIEKTDATEEVALMLRMKYSESVDRDPRPPYDPEWGLAP